MVGHWLSAGEPSPGGHVSQGSSEHDYVVVGAWQRRRSPGGAAHRGPERARCCCWRPVPRRTPTRSRIPVGVLGAVQDQVGLELLDHRAEAAARPPRLLAADEGARRLLLDERDDLHPRQPRRLRLLARRLRRHRLGVRRRAALLRAGRGQHPARRVRCTGRTGRCTSRTASTPTSSASLWVDSAVSAGHEADRRLQRRRAGGRRALPGDLQEAADAGRSTTPTSQPARTRPNLDVETGAFATRIEIEGDRRHRGDLPGRRSRGARRAPVARCCCAVAR